jgi:hypothetical protein
MLILGAPTAMCAMANKLQVGIVKNYIDTLNALAPSMCEHMFVTFVAKERGAITPSCAVNDIIDEWHAIGSPEIVILCGSAGHLVSKGFTPPKAFWVPSIARHISHPKASHTRLMYAVRAYSSLFPNG